MFASRVELWCVVQGSGKCSPPFVRPALGRSQRSSPSPVPRCSAPFMLLLTLRLFGGGECTRVDIVHTVWCSFETASLQLAHWLVLCALTRKLSNDLVSSEGIRCLFSLCNSLACSDLCWVRSPSSQLFLFCQFSLRLIGSIPDSQAFYRLPCHRTSFVAQACLRRTSTTRSQYCIRSAMHLLACCCSYS